MSYSRRSLLFSYLLFAFSVPCSKCCIRPLDSSKSTNKGISGLEFLDDTYSDAYFLTSGCFQEGMGFRSLRQKDKHPTKSASECQALCQKNEKCVQFNWIKSIGCYLKESKARSFQFPKSKGYMITGPRYCVVKLWRSDGKCGKKHLLLNGAPGQCNPNVSAIGEGPCCSKYGLCGNTTYHCNCHGCVNYGSEKVKAIDYGNTFEKFWRDDGKCGPKNRLPSGHAAGCKFDFYTFNKPTCCSEHGFCGTSKRHCGRRGVHYGGMAKHLPVLDLFGRSDHYTDNHYTEDVIANITNVVSANITKDEIKPIHTIPNQRGMAKHLPVLDLFGRSDHYTDNHYTEDVIANITSVVIANITKDVLNNITHDTIKAIESASNLIVRRTIENSNLKEHIKKKSEDAMKKSDIDDKFWDFIPWD